MQAKAPKYIYFKSNLYFGCSQKGINTLFYNANFIVLSLILFSVVNNINSLYVFLFFANITISSKCLKMLSFILI